MKVIIGDWHIGDESVRQNIPNKIVVDFFQEINKRIRLAKAKELEIILNGDIIDILSSDKWDGIKIWDNTQNVQITAEKIIGDIFETSAAKIFQRGVKTLYPIISVKITYIIGNHDRLVRDITEIREKIIKFFGITEENILFADEFLDETTGIYATHGHQYDFGEIWTKEESNGGFFSDKMQICVSIKAMIKIRDMIGGFSEIINTAEVAPKDRRRFVTKILKDEGIDRKKAKMVTKIMRKCAEDFIQSDSAKQRIEDWVKSFRNSRALIKITQGIFCAKASAMFWSRFLFVLGYFIKSSARNKAQKKIVERDFQNSQDKGLRCVILGHTHHYENSKIGANGYNLRYVNLGSWMQWKSKTFSFDKKCRVAFCNNDNGLEIVQM